MSPALKEYRKKYLVLQHLSRKALEDFGTYKVSAVVVKSFITSEQAARMSKYFLSREDMVDYTHEGYKKNKLIKISYGVTRIATDFPYNLTYHFPLSDPVFDRYYEAVPRSLRVMEDASYPDPAPIKRLQRELNTYYPNGASYAEWNGKVMLAGIVRITRPNAKILAQQPHVDSLPLRYHLDNQWSANVYLSVPAIGGELEIWEHKPFTQKEIAKFERSKVPITGKSFCIKPEAGDLILINSRRAHAVRIFEKGTRVSAACFIGIIKNRPLLLWT